MTARRKGNPWVKWYFADWASDPRLRLCSLAARGLWMEMLAVMDEARPRGHLIIEGHVPTDAQLAILAAAPAEQIPELIAELETWKAFSRTAKGVIYSRRMVRDEKMTKTARDNGKRGGNPTLSKTKEKSSADNPPDKPPDKGQLKPQKPEARSQIKKDADDTRASPGDLKAGLIVQAKAVHERCLEVLGVDGAWPGMLLHDQELRWLEAGCDPDLDVLPTVEAVWHRRKQDKTDPPHSMKYFTKAVIEARDERLAFNQAHTAERKDGEQDTKAESDEDEEAIQRVADRFRA